ncbi:MAG: sugar ABC transporter permease [Oscillospiraceae bacterium]|nr:sugar ABC transporter permease [Oscillospiraceae bacterium]
MTKTKQVTTTKKASPKRKGKSLNKVKARNGWVFIAPFLIGFVLIYLPMIVESLRFSFGELKFEKTGVVLKYVGWENYSWALFKHTDFVKTLGGSVGQLLFNVPAIVIFALFVAVLLNQKMRGRAIFRAIFFIPVIVSTGIIEFIEMQDQLADAMSQVASGGSGIGASTGGQEASNSFVSVMEVSRYFQGMAVGQELVQYVTDIVNNVYDIVNKSGVQMLIFLAGLQSVSPAIYESCQMDGATSWEIFWKITFPMISPMILVNAVYTVIDSFTSQDNKMMSLINEVYKDSGGNVRSTAMAWIYFLVVILILLVVAAIMGGYVFYQKRDT